jgi:hypothetical protein
VFEADLDAWRDGLSGVPGCVVAEIAGLDHYLGPPGSGAQNALFDRITSFIASQKP